MQLAMATRYEGYGAKPSGDATSLRPEHNANAPFDHEQDLFRPSAKVTTEQIDGLVPAVRAIPIACVLIL